MKINNLSYSELDMHCKGNRDIDFTIDPVTKSLFIDYTCGKEHASIEFDEDEVVQLKKCINNNYEDEPKIINKKLKDFTLNELKQICRNNNCGTCPLQFLRKGNRLGIRCPITLNYDSLANDRMFFENYFDAIDREISVKESDLKDG